MTDSDSASDFTFNYPNEPNDVQELVPNSWLGEHRNYLLEKRLGEGGMGLAWKAVRYSGDTQQTVVCKLIKEEDLNDKAKKKAREEVRRIFELTQKLNHQYICPLYAFETDPNCGPFLVMAYAEGETLADWFKAQPGHENGLPLKTFLPIFRLIAKALDDIHKEKVFHRDVKPGNIIFRRQGEIDHPWLIDFGIAARIHTEETNMTIGHSRSNSGTAHYMAPEQHSRQAQDGRTDQYAFAVMTYQFLTGKVPFPGDDRDAAALRKALPLPKNGLSEGIYKVLCKAMSINKEDRYAACTEFLDALEDPPSDEKSFHIRSKLVLLFIFVLIAGSFFFSRKEAAVPSAGSETNETVGPVTPPQPPVVRTAGERMVKTVDGIEYVFRWCPAGSFTMGGTGSDEKPHSVTLTKGFWMLETEVTQAMWKSVMGTTVRQQRDKADPDWRLKGEGAEYPIYYVNWEECRRFCEKLSSKLGVQVSLPTEAQWEYACRAGTTGAYAGDLDAMAWYDEIFFMGSTHPVGQKKANAWGLYDMHGNVWEWCSDWYGPYVESPTSDPTGPNSGSDRVYRGGCWDDAAEDCRSADRGRFTPGLRNGDLGFRIVLAGSDK